MNKNIINLVKNTPVLYNSAMYILYTRQFRRYLKFNSIPNRPYEGEDKYKENWGRFGVKIEPYSYRLFSHFCNGREHIVPENIGRCYIEPVLNPLNMRPVYEDKNMFPILCGKDALPKTLVCRMGGGPILDSDYNPISKPIYEYLAGYERVILKPSLNSSSGKNVHLFVTRNGEWLSEADGTLMTKDFLLNYSKNFVVQEAVQQHPDIARFNSTSVNTLRIAVYRSVKDNEPHVLASIMRVGKRGMFVDNAHAGGLYVGIDVLSGKVGKVLYDQYGKKYTKLNDLDYSNHDFMIPCWDKVKDFVCTVSRKLVHHRLFAFDITVDSMGTPKLIEYNISGFSYWLFMFTGQKPLGEYTDEIINYCIKR